MALPLERFFVLIEITQERRNNESREEMTRTAFLAWQHAEHQYAAMFQHVAMTAVNDKNKQKFQQQREKFWNDFPNFNDYLRKLGIAKDS